MTRRLLEGFNITPGEYWEGLDYPSVSELEHRVIAQELAADGRRQRREVAQRVAAGNGRR